MFAPHISPEHQKTLLRLKRDLRDLELHRCQHSTGQAQVAIDCELVTKLKVTLHFTSGLYEHGIFRFIVDISPDYPFHAPRITCLTRCFHPNICPVTGRVSCALLDRDWRPVLSIGTALYGLQLMFLEPKIEGSLNTLAAELLQHDPVRFVGQVRQIMQGGTFFGLTFPCHMPAVSSGDLKRKTRSSPSPTDQHKQQRRWRQQVLRPMGCVGESAMGEVAKGEIDQGVAAMCIQDRDAEELQEGQWPLRKRLYRSQCDQSWRPLRPLSPLEADNTVYKQQDSCVDSPSLTTPLGIPFVPGYGGGSLAASPVSWELVSGLPSSPVPAGSSNSESIC